MKITVWGINYEPEPTGIGPFNTDLCTFLREQGHQVTMVSTFPYYPWWKKRPDDHGKLYEHSESRGVRLHRCWHYVPSQPSTLKRLLHELTFVFTSTLRVLTLDPPDVFVVVSPSLFLGVGAFVASRLLRRPYLFHVQDLQPDAALGLGMIKPGPAVRALYVLEKWTYANAMAVSGISGGMLTAFRRKGVPERRIYFLPNWIPDADTSSERPRSASFRTAHGIPASTALIAYSGNIGAKQGLEVVLDAAQLAEKKIDTSVSRSTHWAICGDGAAKANLQQSIEALGVRGVKLYPLQPDDLYHALLREADICLITQQRGTGQFFFPSKLLSILQYGRPVLAVADETSELARAVHEGDFGLVVPPGDATALLDAANRMIQADKAQVEAWSRNGRAWVDQFRRRRVLGDFSRYLMRRVDA